MPISALPTPPSRQDPTNFNDRADAFLGALPQFQAEANALQTDVNQKQLNATYSATLAAASELAAANTSNATIWVSGTTYAVGANSFSPSNFRTYRRKFAGAGSTDPASDPGNWQLLTGLGDVTLSDNQTITGTKIFTTQITSTGFTTGGQLNTVSGSGSNWYNAMIRNDTNNVYLLSSNVQSTQSAAIDATFNTYRPFSWNLTTGAVTIAGASEPTSINGNTTINGATSIVSNVSSDALTLSSNTSAGSNLKLTGTVGSPAAPTKYIRSLNGALEVINNAYTAPLLQVFDGGDLAFNSGYGSSRVAYGCRAWVNFNGTGTVTIRSSGGVQSITDLGVGDYQVNFIAAMVDANYSAQMSVSEMTLIPLVRSYTTTSVRVTAAAGNNAQVDQNTVSVAIFR